jgi:TonB family protein
MGFLSRLHDGELSASEDADFLRHRRECAECAASTDEYEAVLALYRESGEAAVDPRLPKRILAHLDSRLEKPGTSRFLRLNVDLVLASVAIVCLVGALIAYSIVSPRPISIPRAARTLYVKIVGERQPPLAASKPPVGVAARRPREDQRPSPSAVETAAPETENEGARPVIITELGIAKGDASFDRRADRAAPAPAEEPSREAGSVAKEAAPSAGERVRDEIETKTAPAPSGFSPPTLVRRVEPEIPPAAKNLSLSGSPVVLEAVVDESGNVTNISIVRSNPLFDRRVIDAVRQWKYRPALLGGRPVSVKLTVTLKFGGP